jgi:hypothetical protein
MLHSDGVRRTRPWLRAAAWLKAAMIAEMFRELLFFYRVFLTQTGDTSFADEARVTPASDLRGDSFQADQPRQRADFVLLVLAQLEQQRHRG